MMTSVADDIPCRKSITVNASRERAFDVFTAASTAGGRAATTSASRR